MPDQCIVLVCLSEKKYFFGGGGHYFLKQAKDAENPRPCQIVLKFCQKIHLYFFSDFVF